jgi:hypothetical protein
MCISFCCTLNQNHHRLPSTQHSEFSSSMCSWMFISSNMTGLLLYCTAVLQAEVFDLRERVNAMADQLDHVQQLLAAAKATGGMSGKPWVMGERGFGCMCIALWHLHAQASHKRWNTLCVHGLAHGRDRCSSQGMCVLYPCMCRKLWCMPTRLRLCRHTPAVTASLLQLVITQLT